MAFRYKLRALLPADTAEALLAEFSEPAKGSNAFLAESRSAPWSTIVDQLKNLGARTLLLQGGVRDPDFLAEHQAYYAKQHRPVSRKSTRIHAFTLPLPDGDSTTDDEAKVLRFLDDVSAKPDGYLGFVTLRPLKHAPVGASIIAAPAGAKATTSDEFPVHIAGTEFTIVGTPFLQQDAAVGACAQASIWMALRTLRRRHGNAAFSPAALTAAATRYLAPGALTGRQGLTLPQMLEAIRYAGHETLHLPVKEPGATTPADIGGLMAEAVPYLESGQPVVLCLASPSGGHAVVAIGCVSTSPPSHTYVQQFSQNGMALAYGLASNWASSLLIHNDNSGPYLTLPPSAVAPGYALDQAVSLIVALPSGVFTTASEAELLSVQAFILVSTFLSVALTNGTPNLPALPFVIRKVLCTRHAFRSWAKEDTDLDPQVRDRYRTHELPKYLWVIEIHDEKLYDATADTKSRCGEIIIDASADPFHADALIFANVTAALFPSAPAGKVGGVCMVEDEDGPKVFGTTPANPRGRRIETPWK